MEIAILKLEEAANLEDITPRALRKRIEENKINYYMIGSLTENINGDGIPDGVYFEVEIEKDNVNITEKHLNISNN